MGQPALRGLEPPESGPEDTFRAVFARAIQAVESAGVPYVVIGGVGSASLGRPRWTRDIDLLVAPVDADRTLDALDSAGFETERTNEHWIFKATRDDIVVDVIFKSMGDVYLDDDMLSRSQRADFLGVSAQIAPREDQVVIKAIAHDEQSSRHWNDALALIAAGDVDWEYLLERGKRGPRRILSLLVYAQSNDLVVPNWAIETLYQSIYEGG